MAGRTSSPKRSRRGWGTSQIPDRARGIHIAATRHCAPFDPANTAVLLSRQRTVTVAGLMRLQGVSHVASTGADYSQPLPSDPPSASNRVVIVTTYPKK